MVSIAAAVWLLTTIDVPAQIPMPAGQQPAPSLTASVLTSGQQMIGTARSALTRKDFRTAVNAFRHAAAIEKSVPQLAPQIAQLRSDLIQSGIDAELLTLPPILPTPRSGNPSTMQRLPSVLGAKPIAGASRAPADPAARKADALRLVAIGRAALDRGDASTALTIARQAQSLKVPEKDFAPGEPRVWQLVLDAESAARRSGIALTSGTVPAPTTTTPNPVQPAIAFESDDEARVIAQMLFNTEANAGATAGSVQQVQNIQPLPPDLPGATGLPGVTIQPNNPAVPGGALGQVTFAERMYYEGIQALTSGNREKAREKFLEAWKFAGDLDPEKRRQVRDKLTLLQPSRKPAAADKPPAEMTAIERANLAAQEETQRLYREVTAELANANESKETAPLDALDQLEGLRRRVDSASIDETAKRSIMVMVDRAVSEQKLYVENNRAKIELDLQNQAVRAEMDTDAARNALIDEEISSLVKTFNELIDDRRFQEAEVVAKQVSELKPESTIATTMFHTSRMGIRLMMNEEIADKKEHAFWTNMHDMDRSMVGPDPDRPYAFPDAKEWDVFSRQRLEDRDDSRLSVVEQEIQRKMSTTVSVDYRDRALGEVLEELSAMTGVPIVIDNRALSAVRVTTDTPVTLRLPNDIALQSVLNIILGELELTHVIENDVLSVTSMEARRSMVYPRTYRVTDLVTPIPNFTSSYEDGLAGALRASYQMINPQTDIHIMPVSPTDLGGNMANSMSPQSLNPNVLGQYHGMGSQGGFGPSSSGPGGRGGGSFADFQSLIDLIQTTVVPDTWEALGGPSTMAPYPQNLSLVISTTSDVHDQIADLLESLRRLQNLQITIEVRFITLSDTFFEQIGVDFDVQFDDNVGRLPDDDSGPSVTIGFDGISGLPTADLDIQLTNNSFGATPPFGAPDAGALSTIGFAILSDIEAFFFLQAAQGDNRNNVMQAPKVTLFDGQIATISDVTQRPFVTSITPVVGDFAVAQQPVIVVLNEGTQLNVQGIVSDDKRFVRLTLVPFFSQIGAVNTFTYEGRRSTSRSSRNQQVDTNGDGVIDDQDATDESAESDFVEGTTVQLPTFAFTQVSTTVSVPDGGTILLGGIKRLAEGRSERGIPMLSKIPYVSRLFRNVAVGRDARSLMLMVTPRIIIQEEEELAQTGFDPTR